MSEFEAQWLKNWKFLSRTVSQTCSVFSGVCCIDLVQTLFTFSSSVATFLGSGTCRWRIVLILPTKLRLGAQLFHGLWETASNEHNIWADQTRGQQIWGLEPGSCCRTAEGRSDRALQTVQTVSIFIRALTVSPTFNKPVKMKGELSGLSFKRHYCKFGRQPCRCWVRRLIIFNYDDVKQKISREHHFPTDGSIHPSITCFTPQQLQ